MAKIDYYVYGTPTAVETVTLSNCDSTTPSDYKVYLEKDNAVWLLAPTSISGSTMNLKDSDNTGLRNCDAITVIQA